MAADEELDQLADAPIDCSPTIDGQEGMVRSHALGANAYVQEPVDFVAFVSAARGLGLFWLLHNEPPQPGRAGP